MNGKIVFTVDDDVHVTQLVSALANGGLTVSNVDGYHLRVHRAERLAKVIDLAARRRLDAQTDEQIRAGMRGVFYLPPGTELEHGPVGLPPDGPEVA